MTDFHAAKYLHALEFAQRQVAATIEREPDFFPAFTKQGRWRHDQELWTDWTGGFFAGMMWQFFRHTGDPAWRSRAEHYSRLLEPRQFDANVHDLGFIFLNSYRPWYELTGDNSLHRVLIQAGRTLASRFRERGQYLCSFVGQESLFIDIMMNVPIILYAARESGDAALERIALAHCHTTRDTLVRADGSTAHEGLFDIETGRFLRQSTQQGLRADSTWARGLAWSMYGYSQCYALSGNRELLDVAERNADYWLTHLPKDHVPYWDFHADISAPPPRGAQKDSSAAAIAASGLLDLERQTNSLDRAVAYRQTALAMLDALSGPEYLAEQSPLWQGVLMHAVYHTARNLGVDESVAWGDYFFVEALTKVVHPQDLAPTIGEKRH